MSSVQSFLPIAIVGGGPAALTAARLLQLHQLPCRVYEGEATATARDQGGSLDLHEDTGLWAVQQCGLMDAFNRLSRPEGDCMRILDKTAHVEYSEDPPGAEEQPPDSAPPGRPEIDRLALRNLLLDSLQPDTVKWGHALSALSPLPPTADGVPRWQLRFKNGKTEEAAVVIGADGAWSRIRPLLSSATPAYTGITFVDFTVPHVNARHPHLAELVGPGTACILDDERGLLAQMNGNDTLRTYAALKVPEGWSEAADGGAFLTPISRAAIDTFIARFFHDWHPSALDAMHQADVETVAVRRIYALPSDHRFAHTPETQLVTAVGDAAHVMSPFAGEGVNLAMIDAAQLALALSAVLTQTAPVEAAQVVSQVAEAIAECEGRMFERSKPSADEAAFHLQLFFSEGAAIKFAERMRFLMSGAGEGAEDEAEAPTHPVVAQSAGTGAAADAGTLPEGVGGQ